MAYHCSGQLPAARRPSEIGAGRPAPCNARGPPRGPSNRSCRGRRRWYTARARRDESRANPLRPPRGSSFPAPVQRVRRSAPDRATRPGRRETRGHCLATSRSGANGPDDRRRLRPNKSVRRDRSAARTVPAAA